MRSPTMYVGACVCAEGINGYRPYISYWFYCEAMRERETHKDRRVNNPEALRALHCQVGIHHRAQRDGADRVVNGVGLVADERIELLVSICVSERSELLQDVALPCRSGDKLARGLDGLAHDRDVNGFPENVWVDDWGVEGVGGSEGEIAA